MIGSELVGIAATLFILAGFLFNEERTIRRFNIVGSVLYVLYGVLINSISNVLLNGLLIIVHLYMLNKKEGGSHCQR